MPEDDLELDLKVYLKFNCSPDLPSLVREAAQIAGYGNSADWMRARLVAALGQELRIDAVELLDRQPCWGNGKGAVDPAYVARRYGKPAPKTGPTASKSGVKVSQGG